MQEDTGPGVQRPAPRLEFYEPWRPKLGDVVVIIAPSPECRCWEKARERIHDKLGTVVRVLSDDYLADLRAQAAAKGETVEFFNAHRYGVEFAIPEGLYLGGWFAALELRPSRDIGSDPPYVSGESWLRRMLVDESCLTDYHVIVE